MLGATIGRHLQFVRDELRRDDASLGEKLLHVADRASRALRLAPHVSVNRRIFVQIEKPPAVTRGLRDLVIRHGTLADLEPLATIDDTDRALVRDRFARGDLAYVGELDGAILCHTWFHRGPTPFEEDREHAAAWGLDADTYWSYNGAATTAARSSGVFVKMFQIALQELFGTYAAVQVQGFIRDDNQQSLIMHDRLGFSAPGALSTVVLPFARWHRWEGGGSTRQWITRGANGEIVWLPPV